MAAPPSTARAAPRGTGRHPRSGSAGGWGGLDRLLAGRRRRPDLDPARLGLIRHGQRDGQDAVAVLGRDALPVDPLGDADAARHRAVEALLHQDLLVLAVLRVPGRRDGQDVVLEAEPDVLPARAGHVEADDQLVAATG